jgi:hypothetical protein
MSFPVRFGLSLAFATVLGLGSNARATAADAFTPNDHAMGTAPCAWAEALRAPGNTLDVPATIRSLQENHLSCIAQVIEDRPPYTFDDFKRLLEAAQTAGISVWPVIIPPSEGGTSLPYKTDYVGWMKEMAQLSQKYSALRGVNIDDLMSGISTKTFTRDYICSIYQAKQQINPNLLFVPTIYDLDQSVADRLGGCVDGVWFWWVNLEHNAGMRTVLEDSRVVVAGRFPIYSGVYSHQTSWHKEGRPLPKILRGALEIGCRYGDGAIIWNLPLKLDEPENPWLATARAFAQGGHADLAGKCGLGATSPPAEPAAK